ncbi:MAG: SRPBCC family protein [Acidimicrobiales bacterium]|nr:SRPBCC family protein [Acidimicrobiales bacterium]MCB9395620.1 SRPBCC family protein [Acidimicrobiaceae bacterium]
MASVVKSFITSAPLDAVWDALRAVDQLHTRLVPGFVVDTAMDGHTRLVTFASGAIVREPLITVDDDLHRVVWTSEGGATTHYNGVARASAHPDGTEVEWSADFLPDDVRDHIERAMAAGIGAMKATLDLLADSPRPDVTTPGSGQTMQNSLPSGSRKTT